MGRIILARHGEAEDNQNQILNRPEDQLTQKGRRQAEELGERLRNLFDIRLVLCSPLPRAFDTATICVEKLKIPRENNGEVYPIKMDLLTERSHGILEGKHASLIPLLAKKYAVRGEYTYVLEVEGGEDYHMLYERALMALFNIRVAIANRNQQDNRWDTLVVAHAAIGRAIQAVYKKIPVENVLDIPRLGNGDYVVLE